MTTQEVAQSLVSLCSAGDFHGAMESLYSPEIVSVEAMAQEGGSRELQGLEAVLAKAQWWGENHDIHSVQVSEPIVAGSHFSVGYIMDVTFKPADRRMTMEEVAVYKVVDGKIVYEEFFYSM